MNGKKNKIKNLLKDKIIIFFYLYLLESQIFIKMLMNVLIKCLKDGAIEEVKKLLSLNLDNHFLL